MYDEPEENLTLDELAAVAVVAAVAAAWQSGSREVSAKAPVRPRRECSTAAADARARNELELEQALAVAEVEEGERRRSWALAQQLEAVEAEKEELELERLRLDNLRREDAVAAQAAAQAAAAKLADAERAAREQLEKQKARSASALAKMRDEVGEWRGRAANLEEQLYEEWRKPDERVRSQNAKALAARAAADARVEPRPRPRDARRGDRADQAGEGDAHLVDPRDARVPRRGELLAHDAQGLRPRGRGGRWRAREQAPQDLHQRRR